MSKVRSRCPKCHGDKNKDCNICNNTGIVIFKQFNYHVASDVDEVLIDGFNSSIDKQINGFIQLTKEKK